MLSVSFQLHSFRFGRWKFPYSLNVHRHEFNIFFAEQSAKIKIEYSETTRPLCDSLQTLAFMITQDRDAVMLLCKLAGR